MSNKTLGVVLAVIIILAVGVWAGLRIHNNSSVKGTAETPAANSAGQASPTNDQTNPPTSMNNSDCVRDFNSAKLQDKINLKNQFVTLSVKNFGDIKVQLYDQDAPKTVENFLRLTHAGFYDCLTFHRVAKDFVIQGGDPNGDGTGGQSAFGKEFADELNPTTASFKTGYVPGVLAMANRGPNTNSSQFFIVLGDVNAQLPKSYTIFGKVVAGMDVVQKIGQVDINPGPFGPTDGTPKVPVVISKAVISDK